MKLRLFISINFPEEIIRSLADTLETLAPKLPQGARILPPDNWHLTISFLGNQEHESMGPLIDTLEEITRDYQLPELATKKIIYGPPGKRPRMVWLTFTEETSRELSKLSYKLEEKLSEAGIRFQIATKAFRAHTTLARFDVSLPRTALLKEEFVHSFYADSLDVMQSEIEKKGTEFSILSRFAFREIA